MAIGSTRTTPRELGACTKVSGPIAIATCDAPDDVVAKNSRSPASTSLMPTGAPILY
jgi:hypothetical protein